MRAKAILLKVGQANITNTDINTILHHIPPLPLHLKYSSQCVLCFVAVL